MQSYNPAIPGCTFSRLLNGRYARKQQNAEKPRVLAINALQPAYLLLLLQPSVLWLSIFTFNNDAKPPPKWFLREFDVSRNRSRLGGLPHLETFMVKFHPGREGYPVSRLGGSPHQSCKRDQLKLRDYMNRRVTPPKRVTSPTWGPSPPCKQALKEIWAAICLDGPKLSWSSFLRSNFKRFVQGSQKISHLSK